MGVRILLKVSADGKHLGSKSTFLYRRILTRESMPQKTKINYFILLMIHTPLFFVSFAKRSANDLIESS